MAYIDFVFKVSSLTLLFIIGTTSRPTTVPKVFDVRRYGAKGDGKTVNTKAFTNTWKDACTWDGPSKMYIPNGRFYLGGVSFVGPCTSKISFVIDGTLLAPPNNNDIKKETWINFGYIDYLTVSGSGTIDGQGKKSWLLNDCQKNTNCPKLAINMGFDFVNKSRMEGITSLNSKAGHLNFFSVDHFNITGVHITAPGDSPNTDGIKIALSSNIQISNTHISTGDDCIAMLSGNTNFDIYNVTCGPGHGISVGSLGKDRNEKNINGLTVRDTIFTGTSDGIRIKTWESSASTIAVSNLVYENLQMIDVGAPINIDQKYCPYTSCQKLGDSHIQIQNVTLKNIWGTSRNKVAVKFQCSKSFPCKNVHSSDINLKHNGVDGPAITLCENIKGSATGKMIPPHCLN
ncbi:PREDICTED: exopolygalacturonase [Camelina sativa]|uniref:Exopolygalacturonase n=1 Tax=Camelina sativa TaxID=90675 RepID=A0ABM0VPL2_CAMSA|nr:PREDICTED: exopolygalacturonase [Camelina sativa]